MRNDRMPNGSLNLLRRALAGLLCLVMLLGLLPALAAPASAAQDWAIPYMQQLVDWNIMRGDPAGLSPERNITRAEFVALMNRAYGYTKVGETPFTDITGREWYADDIAIGYNIGYFKGTSENTASPNGLLTREQAAVVIARNMMLKENPGEVMDFSDGREFSDWSRGLMKSLTATGVITGGADGSFQPQNNITRGEVAAMLVRAIGNPINEAGDYNLGSVYGNVTISSSDVSLRNTTIAGDLFLTGGVDLGSVLLENVTVLGRIVASGGGESNAGQSSIVLRNVQGSEMVVDSISDQFVTIRSEGDTDIGSLEVRTSSYIEDVAPKGYGFLNITLDGNAGMNVQLAGNIKEVVNRTPVSRLMVAQGSVDRITVDEAARGSALVIDGSAKVGELNLDVATGVTGEGDIDHLNVNAAGSTVTMLPDTITVRPGINASVGGEDMDSAAAAESSEDPRLLAGYPAVSKVAPTTATAVFSTNKRGTIYWAISALADGSVGAADLLDPPAYGGIVLQSGTITATASNTEFTANLTGLTSDGSYYLSAILVDNRGEQSPLKVAAFTTPDDTTPDFADGYPVMSKITMNSAQVTVMTNKSCQVFWALLPKGSTAPRPQDFKAGSITGNLGYGSLDAVKNSALPFTVNSVDLEEKQEYDLYLWLNDYNGAKSSSVEKITFATVDGTPPIVRYVTQTEIEPTSVALSFVMNEPGTLFWVIVPQGEDFFRPLSGQTTVPEPTDTAAKMQVESGFGATKKGNVKAAKAETETPISKITGLTAETAYDFYYVAKDEAGNYSDSVQKITINTEDGNPPTVTQEFTSFNSGDNESTLNPLADTDIRLVFSESIQGVETVNGQRVMQPFMDLYNAVLAATSGSARDTAREAMAAELRKHIKLYNVPAIGQPALVADRGTMETVTDEWIIDYRYARIEMEGGKMVVTFPTSTTSSTSALNLQSGSKYYFELVDIADTSAKANRMGKTTLPEFTTVFAQVLLTEGTVSQLRDADMILAGDPNADENGNIPIDMSFIMDPQTTAKSDATMAWDALFWSDTNVTFTIYSKPQGEYYWRNEGSASINVVGAPGDGFAYRSLTRYFRSDSVSTMTFEPLQSMDKQTEYAIHIDKIGDSSDRTAWNQVVNFRINVAAGRATTLGNLAASSYETDWAEWQTKGVTSIGKPDTPPFTLTKQFSDDVAPKFRDNFPSIAAGDTQATLQVMLDREGSVYYVVVPLPLESLEFVSGITADDYIATLQVDPDSAADYITNFSTTMLPTVLSERETGVVGANRMPLPSIVPSSGTNEDDQLLLSLPGVNTITSARSVKDTIWAGHIDDLEKDISYPLTVTELLPNTMYYVYLVTKGTGAAYSDYACCFRFATGAAEKPIFTNMQLSDPGVNVGVNISSYVTFRLTPDTTDANDPMGLNTLFSTVSVPDTPSRYQLSTYTVLKALTEVMSDGRTVYDHYATEAAKEQMVLYIGQQQSDPTQGGGGEQDREFTQGSTEYPLNQYINCEDWMTANRQYIFVAAARSQVGSGYSFRANYPVRPVDNTRIEVDNIASTTDWTATKPTTDYGEALAQSYTGSVTVRFTDYVNIVYTTSDNRQGHKQVSQSKSTDLPGGSITAAEYVPLGAVVDADTARRVEILDGAASSPTMSLTFDFKNFTRGMTISFSYPFCGENGVRRGVLTLTMVVGIKNQEEGSKYYEPDFIYSWSEE